MGGVFGLHSKAATCPFSRLGVHSLHDLGTLNEMTKRHCQRHYLQQEVTIPPGQGVARSFRLIARAMIVLATALLSSQDNNLFMRLKMLRYARVDLEMTIIHVGGLKAEVLLMQYCEFESEVSAMKCDF